MIKLKSWNYGVWKSIIEDLLYMKYLHEPIEGKEVRPADLDDKKWAQFSQMAMSTIRLQIDQSVYHHVAKESRVDVLQRKLEIIYEQPTAQNKVSLMKTLVNLKYKEGHSITEHTSEFQGLVDKLTTMKIVLDDELQVLLLFSSLPNSWETLVVSVNNSALNEKLTLDIVTDKLRNEESRRKRIEADPYELHALISKSKKGRGEVKAEIPVSRTMITPKEDLSPREKT